MKADLPEEAQVAWHAYIAMSESKQNYFCFLQALDEKYQQGGSATDEENLKLEALLSVHDKNVMSFNDAMNAIEDVDARSTLLQALGAKGL